MVEATHTEKSLFILGTPRSGTSWLAKIFDAHPDVLYRHEPDTTIRADHIPFMCDATRITAYQREGVDWLNQLVQVRRLKSSGTIPIFSKSYHTSWQTAWRRILIFGLKLLQYLPKAQRLANVIDIPDFVSLDSPACKRVVIKSVSSMGRTGLIAAASPRCHIILIIRHPCGHVTSMLHGIRNSMFEDDIPFDSLPETFVAKKYGLTAEGLAKISIAEKLAWSWVVHNEIALKALEGVKHARIVRYVDLALRPEETARMLFVHCGLDWRDEVSTFIKKSVRANGSERYYELRRNPRESVNRWRRELPDRDVEAIFKIVQQTTLGKLFEDL